MPAHPRFDRRLFSFRAPLPPANLLQSRGTSLTRVAAGVQPGALVGRAPKRAPFGAGQRFPGQGDPFFGCPVAVRPRPAAFMPPQSATHGIAKRWKASSLLLETWLECRAHPLPPRSQEDLYKPSKPLHRKPPPKVKLKDRAPERDDAAW